MDLIPVVRYFPDIDAQQKQRFKQLIPLYEEWNRRINVISRKDIDNLEIHHILHSLALARFYRFAPHATIMDAGTGGGFPGIPLSILFPECHFTLVDSVAKKIKVVQAVVEALDLQNVTPLCARAEQVNETFDFVVSRALTQLPIFTDWVWSKIRPGKPHGIFYFKGGDFTEELSAVVRKLPRGTPPPVVYEIKQCFEDDFFSTKKIVYITR